MPFHRLDIKGIGTYWIEQGLEGEPLHLHISTTEPGTRAHPPHVHGGYEAFFLLEGEATLEFADETVGLSAGEAVVFDPHTLHGLVNSGTVPNRYMVILVASDLVNP